LFFGSDFLPSPFCEVRAAAKNVCADNPAGVYCYRRATQCAGQSDFAAVSLSLVDIGRGTRQTAKMVWFRAVADMRFKGFAAHRVLAGKGYQAASGLTATRPAFDWGRWDVSFCCHRRFWVPSNCCQ